MAVLYVSCQCLRCIVDETSSGRFVDGNEFLYRLICKCIGTFGVLVLYPEAGYTVRCSVFGRDSGSQPVLVSHGVALQLPDLYFVYVRMHVTVFGT